MMRNRCADNLRFINKALDLLLTKKGGKRIGFRKSILILGW